MFTKLTVKSMSIEVPTPCFRIISGDGACFFRCLAVALENDEGEHETYRQDVTKHLISVIDAVGESDTEQGAHPLYQMMSTSLPVEGDLLT